jgi:HEAT repeat protein
VRQLATLPEQVTALSLDAALGCDVIALFDFERSKSVFERALKSVDDTPVTELLAMLTLFADSLASTTVRHVADALVACVALDAVPLARRRQTADVLSLVAPASALDAMLDDWLDSPSSERRGLALRALARPRAFSRVARISRALGDDDVCVAIDAAEALGTIGGREAARALSSTLTTGGALHLRRAVASALARIHDGGSEAREALVALVDDDDPELRLSAVLGLFEHHEPGSLTVELVDDRDPRVRVLVATYLSERASGVDAALLEKLARDPDARVSRAALRRDDRHGGVR